MPIPVPGAHYAVRIHPANHELDIELRLTGPAASGRVRLEIPSWVPGDYSFDSYARDLFDLVAQDGATGRPLALRRVGWQAFEVDDVEGDLLLRYRASACAVEFGEPAGIVDSDYAVLLGTRYLHVPAYDGTLEVSYALPDGWDIHHPAGARRSGTRSWIYPSYEILLDTPVVFGHFTRLVRTVAGTDFFLVFVDRGIGFAAGVEQFADRLAAVAAEFGRMFGGFPFENYSFVLTLNPQADWGLEHLTSTMCGLGPDVFILPDRTANGVRVCAHELFHAWNVRRLRPAPLGHLACRLEHGAFTDGLWVAEGFTRYYEFLASTRAGAYDVDQFFSAVAGYHSHLTDLPAYGRVSATDSSLATYLNHAKYPGRCNSAIDYYDKGMLIAFDADVALRLGGAGQSLDSVFASFYREFAGRGAGYASADIYRHFDAALPGLGERMEAAAAAPGGLRTLDSLERLGFRIVRAEQSRLGLLFRDGIKADIDDVLDDSPAGRSGIAPGDQLLAIDGYAFSPQALQWVASRFAPVRLDLLRGHRRLSLSLTPEPHTVATGLVWNGDASQAERIAGWLASPGFAPAPGQPFSLDFYENFHGVETVV
ncbi:M61 family metallopeptidase [Derxia lacustris]|uniref:M61 family metallopeptidase n=1 Tax=Derxia lacustris TaxID=764842 RepID=UPI000A178376|nr:hypothetical protein [Derxia lacustris]